MDNTRSTSAEGPQVEYSWPLHEQAWAKACEFAPEAPYEVQLKIAEWLVGEGSDPDLPTPDLKLPDTEYEPVWKTVKGRRFYAYCVEANHEQVLWWADSDAVRHQGIKSEDMLYRAK